MADSKEFVRLVEANAALIASLVQALQGMRPAPTPTPLQCFLGHPESPGDPTVDEWLADFAVFVRQCGLPEGERAVVLVDYLGGCAKEEVICHPDEVRRDVGALVSAAASVWAVGDRDVAASRVLCADAVGGYSRALIRLHQRIEGAAPTLTERQALAVLGDGALKHQFVVGVRKEWVRRELRRLMWRLADKPFIVVRGEALWLMCEEEDRVVQMRPVEKATPALSVPVGGSVADVLGLDDVVSVSTRCCRVLSVGVCVTLTGCQEAVTRMCVVWTRCCRVLSVMGVCVTLTGCQEAVTRMCVLWTRCCRVLSVVVCVTLTGCQEVVTRMCVVWTRCCRVLSVVVCVTLTGYQEVVTRMCVVWTRCCRVLSVGVCVTLTGCQEVVTRMCVVWTRCCRGLSWGSV